MQSSTRRLLRRAFLQPVAELVLQRRRPGRAKTMNLAQIEPATRALGRVQSLAADWRTSTKQMDPLPAAELRSNESEVMPLVPAWRTGR